MSDQDRDYGVAEAEVARAELYQTLGQLRDRLNYARRFDEAVDRTRDRISAQKRENPVGFAAGVAGAAAIAGLVVWRVAVGVARRFGD